MSALSMTYFPPGAETHASKQCKATTLPLLFLLMCADCLQEFVALLDFYIVLLCHLLRSRNAMKFVDTVPHLFFSCAGRRPVQRTAEQHARQRRGAPAQLVAPRAQHCA